MIKTPVKGMRDILPEDMAIRNYLFNIIETTAASAGYQKIETPAIEHLANLQSNQGGENESLIFKILKRGDSLKSALASLSSPSQNPSPSQSPNQNPSQSPNSTPSPTTPNPSSLTDSALRYDLTVPLSRFYAANLAKLPTPLKALQIGPVWRADAPQKGRFRQFTQCDMDILGDSSILAEIDTISTVLRILSQVATEAHIQGLTLHLNDRRLLLAAADHAQVPKPLQPTALVILDKLDKIGIDGIKSELQSTAIPANSITTLLDIFSSPQTDPTAFSAPFQSSLDDPNTLPSFSALLTTLQNLNIPNTTITFSPTLVRGMGYYTSSIFECTADGLGSSIAGGGRYDRMIGDFIGGGKAVPACGFSIGFERLVTILTDLNFTPPTAGDKIALLISPKFPKDHFPQLLSTSSALRTSNQIVSILPMARNLPHQISLLQSSGFTTFHKIFSPSDLPNILKAS